MQIVNNTIYEPQGDGIDILDQSKNIQLRNNIIWVESGFDISVTADSEVGFTSDFNILYATGTGQVGLWAQIARPNLAALQDADFTDADSLALNPMFVNPLGSAGVAGYISPTDDGRDNDFHEQSLQGSDHGGSLAPVVSTTTGLPVFPTGTLTADANESPAIDMGDPTDSYSNEPAPNGGYINIGAYGNTAEASLSSLQYLIVTRPGSGGEIWPEGQTFNITWRFDLAPVNGATPPAGTVNILLLQQGSTTPVLTIASAVPNSGEYSWTLPSSIPSGSNYLVEVQSVQYSGLSGTSAQPFTITGAVTTYYINSGTVVPGGWTTAPGSDSNNGLTPATPKASIAGVLAAYHLNAGDTVMVDAGTYDLSSILTLGANASGIIIEGYNGPNYPNISTVFNRGLLSSDVIDVNGAVNLTLENLTVTGGLIGINAIAYSGSTGLTIKNCTIYDNDDDGIQIGAGDSNAQVINNSLYGQLDLSAYIQQSMGIVLANGNVTTSSVTVSGNTIYDTSNTGIVVGNEVNGAMISSNRIFGSGTGISAVGSTVASTITANTVFDDSTGIAGSGNLLISQNFVYEQSSVGLNLTNVYEAIGNTVYDNAEGITSDSYSTNLIANNTVYGNAGAGIVLQYESVARGNTVYGNASGIVANYGSGATIQNNLIYENSNQGILFYEDPDCTATNNTIYQPQGDAIDVGYESTQEYLQNNILWTQAGYDMNVAPTGEAGLQSDYNDLYATGNGAIGLWEGQAFNSLASWILELNLDQHSISANPQFVNAAGPDGVLGFQRGSSRPIPERRKRECKRAVDILWQWRLHDISRKRVVFRHLDFHRLDLRSQLPGNHGLSGAERGGKRCRV